MAKTLSQANLRLFVYVFHMRLEIGVGIRGVHFLAVMGVRGDAQFTACFPFMSALDTRFRFHLLAEANEEEVVIVFRFAVRRV